MDEVDSIILYFLRQLNIKVDQDVKNICDLSVEIIIESASKCLSTINKSLKLPANLPQGVSHRIEVAAQIASTCKDLGYKGEVGYQTFLYYNEAELRQVFMFLIERLPNESKQTSTTYEPTNKKTTLMHNISNKIKEELTSVWIPPCCEVRNRKTAGDFIYPKDTSIHCNLSEEDIMQKLLMITSKSSKENISADKKNVPQYQKVEKKAIEDTKEAIRETPIEITKSSKELKEIVIGLRQKVNLFEGHKNAMEVEYSQALKKCEKVEADLKSVQDILNSIGITNIDSNIEEANVLEKLQNKINMLHRNNEELTSKNLSLKAEIDKLRNNNALNDPERIKCKKILTNLKDLAKKMNEENEKKEELKRQLINTYEKLKGGNKRSTYTKRIMEIISNVDKQNMEIKKILDDTKELQKEINMLEGQLDRCFSIADETLFKDAKKDDQAKKAYKLLALLHSECNSIISLVNDTGTLARDIVDLEDNIKTEKAKKTEDTLRKVLYDLSKMQEESLIPAV